MHVTEVHHVEGGFQIGGGAGYVAAQVREASKDAQVALVALRSNWNTKPSVQPHPREAALAAARESVLHLNEALSVEAPEDALIDTRHALEELTVTIATLERMGNNKPLKPGALPTGNFERALELLLTAEHKLMSPEPTWGLEQFGSGPIGISPSPTTPHIMNVPNENSGIVPPWLK